MSFISVWMNVQKHYNVGFAEESFPLPYSQKLKEKKLQAKKNKLEQKKQEKGQWNLVFFSKDLVLFPNWSLEGFVLPPAPSILNTLIRKLSHKLVILADVSKVLFESHLCSDLILQIARLLVNIFPLLGEILDSKPWHLSLLDVDFVLWMFCPSYSDKLQI